MRQIALDTETTGLETEEGHRIVEIGCVEVVNRVISDNTFHCFLNPERDIADDVVKIHGLSREQLQDAPRFGDVCQGLLDFAKDAQLIIHNAEFDISFLDAEMARLGRQPFLTESKCDVVDTLVMARRLHPGLHNNLDALSDRYTVDRSSRQERHGALIDAELLAKVYLAMTGGQTAMQLSGDSSADEHDRQLFKLPSAKELPVISANDEEQLRHDRFVKTLLSAQPRD